MKIDRHNYEEYFILYMDNELNSDERRMVEAFVQLHPDLKEELEILSHYKITPDTNITYTGKEELMKMGDENYLLPTSFEEELLLYIDNELPAAQRKEMDQLLSNNSSAYKQMVILQQTKLQPETILFTHKNSLYRKEDKVRRLPYMRWAAAAILLITVGISTFIVVNNKPSKTPDIAISKKEKEPTAIIPNDTNAVNQQVATAPLQNNPATTTNTVKENPGIEQQQSNPAVVKRNNNTPAINKTIPVNNSLPIKNNDPVIVENKPNNNLPKPLYNPASNSIVPKDAVVKNNNPEEIKTKNSLTIDPVTTVNSQPLDIVNASFTDEGGNKKSKLRGIFRKVTRTFEKRTNIDATDGSDRLLVAGLSFKVK